MFVEELLVPIRNVIVAHSDSEVGEVREKALTFLAAIESRPLKKAEANLIKVTLTELLTRFQLEHDTKLIALINKRFSYEYLPGVSSLGLQNIIPKDGGNVGLEDISIELNQKDVQSRAQSANSQSKLAALTSLDIPADQKRWYYLCSVRRFQTALSTTYRMYLDGTKEFDNAGSLVNTTMNETPVLLLAAKKFKTGTPSQCYFWNNADTKLWKDKSAVGKVTRLPNNTYCGVPLVSSGQDSMLSSPVPRLDGEYSPVNSPSVRDGTVEDTAGTSQAGPVLSKVKSATRWSFRQPTSGSNNASGSSLQSAAESTTAGGAASIPDGGIAFSMNCQGMDKLIHFSGVAARSSNTTPSTLLKLPSQADFTASSFTADTADAAPTAEESARNVPQLNSNPQGEQALVDKLEALAKKELSQEEAEAQALTLLRSKQPRKMPSAGGKTLHTVAFSKESRVKAASRKNLVVDTVAAGSAALAQAAEWTTESSVPPILQVIP